MDLDRLQSDTADLMRGIEHPRMGAALALAEECGEVVRCVLEGECYGAEVVEALEAEVGDVLLALAEVCGRYDLSLDRAAEKALARLRARAPEWRRALGSRLSDLRSRIEG